MDILGLIKDKLTDTVADKVSGFLGESPEKISGALSTAVPAVLGGIMQHANDETDTQKIMDIVKDGGHTGEILDDLSGLLNNFDKTQLLITIGSNIFNHFFGNKANAVVEKLASISGIRKTSASSLLGLASPLVLGALGKIIDKEGLGVSGLGRVLNDQKDSVLGALPPAITNQLNVKPTKKTGNGNNTSVDNTPAKPTEKPVKNGTKSGFNIWIPIVLFALLGLGALAYLWNNKRNALKNAVKSDSTQLVLSSQDSLKVDDSLAVGGDSTTQFDSTSTQSSSFESKPAEEIKPLPKEEPKKEVEKPAETKKIEPVKKETPVAESTSTPSTSSGGSVSEQIKSSKAWIGLSGVKFRKGNADIASNGEIDELAKYLKANRKAKISIAGGADGSARVAEDRAWALYGKLYDKGVGENQMEVKSSRVTDAGDASVVVKFIKR